MAILSLLIAATTSVSVFAMDNQPLSLNSAIAKTLAVHPDLKAYAYKAKANQGRITQSSVSSPVTFNVTVEDALGSGNFSGVSAMKTSLSIAWLVEDAQIKAGINLTNKQAKLVTFEKQNKALDIAAKTARIYIILLAQKEQFKLAKLALSQANKAFSEVEKRVDTGKSHIVDQLRAKANVASKELVVEDLSHEIEASRAKLAAQWQGKEDFIVSDSLLNIPTIVAVEQAYLTLKQHPKFKQLATEQQITSAAVALAKVKENPAWQFRAGLKHDNFNDDIGVVAGISIPFGGENRNQGEIIKLHAEQNVKQAETDAWQKHTATQLLLVSHQLKHNRHVIEGLSDQVVPALEQASYQAQQAYAIGRYRYSEWYDVQQALIDAQFDLIDAYANVHLLNIELQRLTGSSLELPTI